MGSLRFTLSLYRPIRRPLAIPDFRSPTLVFSPPSLPHRAAALLGVRNAAAATSAELLRDGGATVLVVAGAYGLVLAFDSLTKRNVIEQLRNILEVCYYMTNKAAATPRSTDLPPHRVLLWNLSRKVVHVLSGVLFMSSWPIFSSSVEARYFAATVPLLNLARLVIYGLSFVTDEGLIKSITREGKPEELLRGPLYYVMVLMICALVFWRDSPVGILVLAMMSGGDGFADIVGRRYGALKLPYNRHKSWLGSVSMFVSGFLFSIGMLYYFSAFGYIHLDWGHTVLKVAVVSLVATLVESLPISDVIDDNISVPLSTMLIASLAFGHVPPH